VKCGYRFSSEDTSLWRDYLMFPLMSLHHILSEKVIPYRDNATTLRRLIDRYPKMALSASYLAGNLASNYAFHESAHCVAHSLLAALHAAGFNNMTDRERFTLEAIFAEAYANTVETLGTLPQFNSVADLLFYRLNAYIPREAKQTELLEKAFAISGEANRFRMLFLGYFEANLTDKPVDDAVIERIAFAAAAPLDQMEAVRGMAEVGFGLSKGFRLNTTPAYFAHLGYEKEYAALASVQWLGQERNRGLVQQVTDVLAATLF
jgi:hypothetical protein